MSINKRIVIILGILLVTAFTVMCMLNQTKDRIEFDPLDGQLELLAKVYPKWFGENQDISSIEHSQTVLCDWFYYKSLAAKERDGWIDASEQFNADAMDMVMSSSIQSLYWVGETAFEDLMRFYEDEPGALEKITAKCPDKAAEIMQYLPEDREGFLNLSQKEGFLTSDGKFHPKKKAIIHLLYRHIWTTLSAEQFPLERISPPEEQIAFLRWQIEQSTLDFQSRLDKLLAFENVYATDNYDFNYAKGVLFFKNHLYGEACLAFKAGRASTNPANTFRIERYNKAIKTISQAHSAICNDNAAQ